MSDIEQTVTELTEKSNKLNLQLHAEGITDAERDSIAAEKRVVDAELFDLEQAVRAAEEREYGDDAVSTVIEVGPIEGRGF